MPTVSEPRPSNWQPIPVTRRYLRRNAQRAMGGSLIRALVELITNCRDSALRLIAAGQLTPSALRDLPVEVEYTSRGGVRRIVVRDHFEGMSSDIMRQKLLRYGEAASGFQEDNFVRGINARGAKDVGAIGELRFESIYNDSYAECGIREGECSEPTARPATTADRERLQLRMGNGTVVTLTPFPNITIPNFEAMIRDLERHVEIRYRAEGQPEVPVVVKEVRERGGVGREQEVVGFQPEGELILEQNVSLPEFARYGDPARLRLYRSHTTLAIVGGRAGIARMWRSEAGVLVGDGHTAHDITFFHARGAEDPAAEHIFGELHVPQIPRLLREYERVEAQRESDPDVRPLELNPEQVTDPDRLGLNYEHPFVQALEEQVKPLVEAAIAALQRELTPPVQDRVSSELRNALDRLGEQLAERLEVGGEPGGREPEAPLGLTLLPKGLRLEIGKTKRLGIYYRVELPISGELPACHVTASSEAVYIATPSIQLEQVPERPGLFRGSLEVGGRQLSDLVLVQATLADHTATARVSVREPLDTFIVLDRDLQFSQRRYTAVPGRRKRVEIWADPALSEMDVDVSSALNAVGLSTTSVHLAYDGERGIAVGALSAESSAAARDRLVASCGDLSDEADVVFEQIDTRPKLEFTFEDVENFGPGRRFLWDGQSPNKLRIAAKHLTLARVLGPAEDNWPGQNHPETRAILAELLSEAYVYRRIQADLPSLGTGPENQVDPVEYESYRYRYYEEALPLCHQMLTPSFTR